MGVQGCLAFGTLFILFLDAVEAVLFFIFEPIITIWVFAIIAMMETADFLATSTNYRAPWAMTIFKATFHAQIAANGAIWTKGT